MKVRNQKPEKILFIVLFTLIALQLLSFKLRAKDMQISIYGELMPNGPKGGVSLGYRFAETGAELGGFYQKSIVRNNLIDVKESEDSFIGIYCGFNVVKFENFVFKMKVRAGMINEKMFTITPNVELAYSIGNNFSLGMGVGIRNLRPTLMQKVSFRF